MWERGAGLPQPQTILKLAEALGCKPSILLRNVQTPYDEIRGVKSLTFGGVVLSAEDSRWLAIGRALDADVRETTISMLESILRGQGRDVPNSGAVRDGRLRRRSAQTGRERPTEDLAPTARYAPRP